MLVTDDHQEFVSCQIPKRIGGFAKDRLLSPSLSSTPSGGEGARRAGEEALLMLVTDDHQEFVSCQIPKRLGGFAEGHLLSPSLSSTPSGGEGARRAGEEALLKHSTGFHRDFVSGGLPRPSDLARGQSALPLN